MTGHILTSPPPHPWSIRSCLLSILPHTPFLACVLFKWFLCWADFPELVASLSLSQSFIFFPLHCYCHSLHLVVPLWFYLISIFHSPTLSPSVNSIWAGITPILPTAIFLLVQCVNHDRVSVHICWMNDWMNEFLNCVPPKSSLFTNLLLNII